MKDYLNIFYLFSFLLVCFLMASCQQEDSASATATDASVPQLSLLPSSETGIDFKNTIVETVERNLGRYDYFFNGSGLAIADFNNDGLQDVFFCGNDTDNRLYLNQGDWKFKDASSTAGFDSKNKWSTGATAVDINEDGWMDIYVCNSGPYNAASSLANQLYVNNGDGTFTEKAAEYGIDNVARSTQAAFFDMDQDGDLDLFVMNHSLRNIEPNAAIWHQTFGARDPETNKREINTLYRNEGNGSFTDVTQQAGVSKVGFGLGLSISDFDKNGYLDIFVANDYFVPDFLYMNNGDGTFTDKIKTKAPHISYYSMGCDAADINNDGLVDLAVVDMTPADHFRNKTLMASMNVQRFEYLNEVLGFNRQYMFNAMHLNRGYGVFSDIGLMAGVSQTDWSWAALLADFDNDGYKDFLVSNGYWRDTKDNDWRIKLSEKYEQDGKSLDVYFNHLLTANSTPIPNYLFKNNGDLTFSNQSDDWKFDTPSFSHGTAYADMDNDGDLDIIINNLGSEAFVYRNNARQKDGGNYLQFELTAGSSMSKCLNAEVEIEYGAAKQLVEYTFVRGYQSCMQPLAHFGLGEVSKVDRAIIRWPNGKETVINAPAINQRHKIDMEKATQQAAQKDQIASLFANITGQQQALNFRHRENDYNDFATEVLLPHQQSRLGPCLAVGDINGDGLDDFYVGGAKGQIGQMYIQQSSMAYVPVEQSAFGGDEVHEDLGAVFFDADQDGDLDLYVASGGGGAFKEGSSQLQDRLYLNNGLGRFAKASNALPEVTASTATIAVADWDKDGDLDLFVGGRTNPGKYPRPPQSYLLQNDQGKFTDVTEKLLPTIARAGMVTDAIWTDVDQDGWPDLMLAGEWMPITIIRNDKGTLSDMTENTGLKDQKGWWYQIEAGDFDGDGDEDFIVGNIGLNNKFHPSEEKNLHVFSNDFDDNNTLDIVLSKHYKGNKVPVRGKECSTEQMPFLADKFKSYASFASSTMEDIYGREKLEEALHYQVNNFAHLYIENKGGFKFEFSELPVETQIAPVNSIVAYDFDQDGHLDVVIGGNMFESEVETPAYDAGKGLFLKGNGDGTFKTSLYMPESGLFLHRNVKAIEMIRLGAQKRPGLLIGNNNEGLEMYVWTKS
jgi:hypothetical protein